MTFIEINEIKFIFEKYLNSIFPDSTMATVGRESNFVVIRYDFFANCFSFKNLIKF